MVQNNEMSVLDAPTFRVFKPLVSFRDSRLSDDSDNLQKGGVP